MRHSLTFLIPALNEEGSIKKTYVKAINSAKRYGLDYEIIIINDGSTDRTGAVAEDIKKQDPCVQVIHNKFPKGMGYGYKEGLTLTNKEYFMLIPGDDAFDEKQIALILEKIGAEDIIIPFTRNSEVRPKNRQFFSNLFTDTLNLLFNLDIKYYNGIVLHQTKKLKNLNIRSNKFTYQAEILIKLIKKRKCSYCQVGLDLNKRKSGESSAVRFANFIDVGKFYLLLLSDIYLR